MASTTTLYKFGPFQLDARERSLGSGERDLPISPKLFEVLLFLVQNSNQLLTKDVLLGGLWPDTIVEESNLARSISSLRALLGDDPRSPVYIETVPWKGYRFIGSVKEIVSGNPAESLAVVPFRTVGLEPEEERLSQALMSALVDGISDISKLKVISSHAVLRYLASNGDAEFPDLSEAGTALKVDAIVTGRIFKSGKRLALDLELVDTRDSSHMWGSQYSQSPATFLNVCPRILSDLATRLRLEPPVRSGGGNFPLTAPRERAAQAYRKGRFFLEKVTLQGAQKALELFQQSLREDPNFALAYAGLMQCYTSLGDPAQARRAARQALDLDPLLAEVHAALAFNLFLYDWDWDGAAKSFETALKLNPGYANAHHGYAIYLAHLGEHDLALPEARLARDLQPLSLLMSQTIGNVLCLARRYDEAIRALQKTLALDDNYLAAHSTLGICYAEKGLPDRAITEFKRVLAAIGDAPAPTAALRAYIGYAYAVSGKTSKARQAVQEVSSLPHAPPFQIASIHARLEKREEALQWLERAYVARNIELVGLKVNPAFDGLRCEPRFKDLCRKVGLA